MQGLFFFVTDFLIFHIFIEVRQRRMDIWQQMRTCTRQNQKRMTSSDPSVYPTYINKRLGEAWLSAYHKNGGTGHYTANMKAPVYFNRYGVPKRPFSKIIIRKKAGV